MKVASDGELRDLWLCDYDALLAPVLRVFGLDVTKGTRDGETAGYDSVRAQDVLLLELAFLGAGNLHILN